MEFTALSHDTSRTHILLYLTRGIISRKELGMFEKELYILRFHWGDVGLRLNLLMNLEKWHPLRFEL